VLNIIHVNQKQDKPKKPQVLQRRTLPYIRGSAVVWQPGIDLFHSRLDSKIGIPQHRWHLQYMPVGLSDSFFCAMYTHKNCQFGKRKFFRWRGGDFVISKREFPVALDPTNIGLHGLQALQHRCYKRQITGCTAGSGNFQWKGNFHFLNKNFRCLWFTRSVWFGDSQASFHCAIATAWDMAAEKCEDSISCFTFTWVGFPVKASRLCFLR